MCSSESRSSLLLPTGAAAPKSGLWDADNVLETADLSFGGRPRFRLMAPGEPEGISAARLRRPKGELLEADAGAVVVSADDGDAGASTATSLRGRPTLRLIAG